MNILLGDNPNYLRMEDYFFHQKDGYIITEYCNQQDLVAFINQAQITEDLILEIIKQICSVLFILKQDINGFLHSDLKTKNILVSNKENKDLIFKIADFDKSSIFFNGVRFYNAKYNYTLGYGHKNPFPLSNFNGYEVYCLSNYSIPSLIGKYIGFHEYIMSSPFGFYTSFDFYTFFYSFCQIILKYYF